MLSALINAALAIALAAAAYFNFDDGQILRGLASAAGGVYLAILSWEAWQRR